MIGVWRGTVTRVAGGVWVRIPRVHAQSDYGPCQSTVFRTTALDPQGGTVVVVEGLTVGDRVLIAFAEGNPDDPIIIGRIGG